ncbi:MAG: (deoxy)nucleoside triphosphate pyrophosphohydrolase [Arcanobacterium sp.]|nr:(deoxy)nucleoside triphosphate pyrophosphohydrolase [Arcanobacterium sp.]
MKREIFVVGAALIQDNRVLCAQRSAQMSLPLHWEFPGGKIEPGESEVAALSRELREELGIEAKIGERIAQLKYEYDFGIVNLSVYWAVILAGTPVATEHSELKWCTVAQMQELNWAPADLPIIENFSLENFIVS